MESSSMYSSFVWLPSLSVIILTFTHAVCASHLSIHVYLISFVGEKGKWGHIQWCRVSVVQNESVEICCTKTCIELTLLHS